MVEICCELKEAARASSICWAEIPKAAARARSMATLTVGLGQIHVAGDILEARRLPQRVHQLAGGVVELVQIQALQRVLILRLGEIAADADDRRVLHEDVDARNLRQLRPQLLDDLIGRELALVARHQPEEEIAGIAGRPRPARPH